MHQTLYLAKGNTLGVDDAYHSEPAEGRYLLNTLYRKVKYGIFHFQDGAWGRRTIVWDVSEGEVLAELPPSSNWNFATAWSPTAPGVFATASFDGEVSRSEPVVQRGW